MGSTTSDPAKTLLRIRTSDLLTLTVFGVKLHKWRRFPAPLVGGIMPTLQQLFRRKPVTEMSEETGADTGKSELARTIGTFQLSMFGVGATIGTGIFFVLSQAVPIAGPAVVWSLVVAGCLLLEYGVSGAAVAVGWSQYLNELLDNLFGFQIPDALSSAPEQGGIINLPAVILIPLAALLLIRGASESATVNTVMVLIKIG